MKLTGNLKNIISLFSVDLGSKFLGFLATTYIARVLGKSGFGAISIGLAVLVYVQILSSSGLTLTGTKKTASDHNDLSLFTGDVIFLRLLLTIIVFLVAFVISNFFITSNEIRIIVLVYIICAFPAVFLLDWFFSGLQKMEITSAGRIIGALFYLIAVIVLVRTSEDTVNTGIALIISGIVNTVFIWYFYKKLGYKVKIRFERVKKIIPLLKESAPLGLASLLSQAAIIFPAIYLGVVSTTSNVGTYSAAFKFITFLLIFDRVFVTVFFPKIVQTFSQTSVRLEEIFNRALKLITILALVIGIPVVITGGQLIILIFGKQFQESVIIFQILIAFFVFTLMNSVLSYTLIAINREKIYIFALMTALIGFVSLIIILYNHYAIIGIALSLIVYEVIQLLVMIVKINKIIPVHSLSIIVFPIVAALIIITIILNLEISTTFRILSGIFIGIPFVAFAGGLTREDINYVKRLLI